MGFCTNCGSELREGVSFCTSCGAPVGTAESSAADDAMKTTAAFTQPTVPPTKQDAPSPAPMPAPAPQQDAPSPAPMPAPAPQQDAPAPAPIPAPAPQQAAPAPSVTPTVPMPGAIPAPGEAPKQPSAPQESQVPPTQQMPPVSSPAPQAGAPAGQQFTTPPVQPQAAPGEFSRTPAQPQKKSRKGLIIALVVIIAAALVAGGLGIAWMKGAFGGHGGNSGSASGSSSTTATTESPAFLGTWEVTGLDEGGVYYTASEYGIEPGSITITFEEDGTAHMDAASGDVMNGTWQATGSNACTVNFGNDENQVSVDGSELTLTDPSGNNVYFGLTGAVAAPASSGSSSSGGSISSSNSAFIGTWDLYAMDADGEYIDLDELGTGSVVTLTLNEDGSASMDAFDGDSMSGSWSANSSSSASLTLDGEQETVTLSDGELTLTDPYGNEMYFR